MNYIDMFIYEWTTIWEYYSINFLVSILSVFLIRALWQFLTLSSLILIKNYLPM